MKQPKYFYVTTQHKLEMLLEGDNIKQGYANFIGSQWWPYTRAEARQVGPQMLHCMEPVSIYQFENTPPYKFIKKVS